VYVKSSLIASSPRDPHRQGATTPHGPRIRLIRPVVGSRSRNVQMVTYSICITHYNNGPTVSASLQSVISQIGDSYEIVVVDNLSNDGSQDILRDFASQGRIRLISKKCTRGVGRQIAFENSTGTYVIANLDMDDTFRQQLSEFVGFYHRNCEGDLLLATADKERWSQNITMGPRALISELGGWRDLQWGEDWDLWRRASRIGRYKWTSFSLAEGVNPHEERRRPVIKIRQRYARYRDMLRLGRRIFAPGESISVSQRVVAWIARAAGIFYKSYDDGLGPFDPYDPSCYIAQRND
jgi:glycosyltransferase involved in cell wall biosynthesis